MNDSQTRPALSGSLHSVVRLWRQVALLAALPMSLALAADAPTAPRALPPLQTNMATKAGTPPAALPPAGPVAGPPASPNAGPAARPSAPPVGEQPAVQPAGAPAVQSAVQPSGQPNRQLPAEGATPPSKPVDPAAQKPPGQAAAKLPHPRTDSSLTLPQHKALPAGRPVRVLPLGTEADARARAERLIRVGEPNAALALLTADKAPAGALLRARAHIALGHAEPAAEALTRADDAPSLAPFIALERGRHAQLCGEAAVAAAALWPLLHAKHFFADAAVLPLASALAEAEPERLLASRPLLMARLKADDAGQASLLAGLLAEAERKVGHLERACEAEVARFVAWPQARETPNMPPACRLLTAREWLGRIERLVDANRNQAAEHTLAAMASATLPPLTAHEACRLSFYTGVVARKQHHYQAAEKALGEAAARCEDKGIERRALFTQAKVISIQDGLRALAPIEAFAKRYGTHSMVDDVLFWAGDSLQRRGRKEEAAAYFQRILALPEGDDHCAEAVWRMAWMAYRDNDSKKATHLLNQALHGPCQAEPWTHARAHYWLGRIAEAAHRVPAAELHYERAMRVVPLHFYAQQAFARSLALPGKAHRSALTSRARRPTEPAKGNGLCPGSLAQSPLLAEALYLRSLGLVDEAKLALVRLDAHWQPVGHAGLANEGPGRGQPPSQAAGQSQPQAQALGAHCGRPGPSLLLATLLDQVGAHPEARRRLSRDFASELAHAPRADTLAIWRQAYPLAYREPLSQAEGQSGLPPFLLQALAREESGFDAEIVSWAEAVGLTQLLLTSGQMAGRSLTPPVRVPTVEALLEPHNNARLGGALLGTFGRQLKGSWPLALAAYNGGFDTAKAWWQRFGGEEFSLFAEEMTVRETRLYVQRVLQTFGIYRWLYTGTCPALATDARLPPFVPAHAAKKEVQWPAETGFSVPAAGAQKK